MRLFKRNKRINIIGAAPGWEDAPHDKGERWGVNNTHIRMKVDLVVDIHDRSNPTEKWDKDHLNALLLKGIPAYSQGAIKGYPNIKKYPLEKIINRFDSDYFGSGIDYMVALAIYKGATEIHIYGVIMMSDTEYAHQKPSVEHWIGIAKGAGIKVRVHGIHSSLLKTKNNLMYGYHTPQAFVKDLYPEQAALINSLKGIMKDAGNPLRK